MKVARIVETVLGITLVVVVSAAAGLVGGRFVGRVVRKAVKRTPAAVEAQILLPSTVRLTRDGKTFCSGIIINDTTMITAAHCVVAMTPMGAFLLEEYVDIRASDNVERGTMAKIQSVSTQLDRATLKGDFKAFKHNRVLSDPEDNAKIRIPGTRMISCGYPMGTELYCATMTYVTEDGFQMRTKNVGTGLLIPGMSGGPTMLPDGTVVGVNSAVEGENSLISPTYNMEAK
jgi:hypothetical protein